MAYRRIRDPEDGAAEVAGDTLDVAVKVFRFESDTKRKIRYFAEEVKLTSQLHHDNTISLVGANFEVLQNRVSAFLVLPFAPLGDLPSFMKECRNEGRFEVGIDGTVGKKKPVPLPSVLLKLCLDIAKGMAYLHSLRILHRDLTAKNILVFGKATDPVAKVADLSVAQHAEDTRNWLRGFMRHYAPECCGEKTPGYYTTKADVFMYSYLVYELIEDRPVFYGPIKHAVAANVEGVRPHFSGRFELPKGFNSSV